MWITLLKAWALIMVVKQEKKASCKLFFYFNLQKANIRNGSPQGPTVKSS